MIQCEAGTGQYIDIEDARLLQREVYALQKDKARLDWLIKQGPPGAAEGQGLNQETWDVGCTMVDDDVRTDAVAIRKGIDAAMREANKPAG